MTYSKKLKDYLALAALSYDDAVQTLLHKYGPVRDNYFGALSYQHFLDGKNTNINLGNHSRGADGLYTHHIQELNFPNIGNQKAIRKHSYPFKYQEKSQLVYADLVEHLILHALIVAETTIQDKLGFGGYIVILSSVRNWYIRDAPPKQKWLTPAYKLSYLNQDEAQYLVNYLDSGLLLERRKYQDISQRLYATIAQIPHYLFSNQDDFWVLSAEVLRPAFQSFQPNLPTLSDDEVFQLVKKLAKPHFLSPQEFQLASDPSIVDKLHAEAIVENQEYDQWIYEQAIEEDRCRQASKEIAEQYAKMRPEIERRRKQIEEERHIAKAKWNAEHQALLNSGLSLDMPREKLLRMLYKNIDHDEFLTFKLYKAAQLSRIKDRLYDDLELQLRADK